MMTLWTGFKQNRSAFDDTFGPNEEELYVQYKPIIYMRFNTGERIETL